MTVLDLTDCVNPGIVRRIGRPKTVLELGCGSGVNALIARGTGAHVVGVEADPALAERARRVLDEVHEVDPTDRMALERTIGARRFDLVLIPTLLESVVDPAAMVALAAGFLAAEGRLIYAVRNREAWPARFGVKSQQLGFGKLRGRAARFYSSQEAGSWARLAELSPLEVGVTPMLAKSVRGVLGEDLSESLKQGETQPTGFRDWSLYELYVQHVLPLETKAAELSPSLFAYQHVVVARKPAVPGPLSLTVGMLTMDEEPSVERMIDAIRTHAPDAQILCVDSSVKDRTPYLAERLGARVLRQLPPRGHGPAMELLMYEAAHQSDALIYLDCDFTYPAEYIPDIRNILEEGADLVNAARTRTRPSAMPLANYVANKAFVACARAVSGVPIADLHSGMRGYRSSLIRSFSFDGEGDALPIDTLLWPARSGYRVVEIPIDYQERVGASKLRKLAGTVWTFIRVSRSFEVGSRRTRHYEAWPDAAGPGAALEPEAES